jgi:hypothetical protein
MAARRADGPHRTERAKGRDSLEGRRPHRAKRGQAAWRLAGQTARIERKGPKDATAWRADAPHRTERGQRTRWLRGRPHRTVRGQTAWRPASDGKGRSTMTPGYGKAQRGSALFPPPESDAVATGLVAMPAALNFRRGFTGGGKSGIILVYAICAMMGSARRRCRKASRGMVKARTDRRAGNHPGAAG